VTIARLEAGEHRDVRVGTIDRLCGRLGLELSALPAGGALALERGRAREAERARRVERRWAHAALGVRLLTAPGRESGAMIMRARRNVDRWERDGLCSRHYVVRWRARLALPLERLARWLVDPGDWGDALFQNSPWAFALERGRD
jgi:hypothetical protein